MMASFDQNFNRICIIVLFVVALLTGIVVMFGIFTFASIYMASLHLKRDKILKLNEKSSIEKWYIDGQTHYCDPEYKKLARKAKKFEFIAWVSFSIAVLQIAILSI